MSSFLVALFGITVLFTSAVNRIRTHVLLLSCQGIILFLILLATPFPLDWFQLIFLGFETLMVKTWIIPVLLLKAAEESHVAREVKPYISNFYVFAFTSILFAFGFFMSYFPGKFMLSIQPIYFGISISTIITALLIILVRRKLITHMIAFIILENGIFLLSLSILKEMPLIVDIGVLLELFVMVFILKFFLGRVHGAFHKVRINRLSHLKDS